ncbi:hypothetical protein E2C01_060704 [Portunus trituberculatus]|uniref:Uncharacterized protein n=1 Tax=Portunus trituberculatus TaxID=210409 RepID=A0A5B7HA68_PORTR|nr:hypothetical protein [Portunus trituberculatus]
MAKCSSRKERGKRKRKMQEEGEVIRDEPRAEDIDQMSRFIVLFWPSIRGENLKGATSAESTSRAEEACGEGRFGEGEKG